jgi:hypothetical protein
VKMESGAIEREVQDRRWCENLVGGKTAKNWFLGPPLLLLGPLKLTKLP